MRGAAKPTLYESGQTVYGGQVEAVEEKEEVMSVRREGGMLAVDFGSGEYEFALV